ncbi:unnamed protein product [Trichobilharzia szidati]|nr:unnamed protein product [Trichobilharzia szidati]
MSKSDENQMNSEMKIPTDYNTVSNNIHEPVLDLSHGSNTNEQCFQHFSIQDSQVFNEVGKYNTTYPNNMLNTNHIPGEQISQSHSPMHMNHCCSDNISSNHTGYYVPNIPTPEQLLARDQEKQYDLNGQINFLNLFRQTWYLYQQYLTQSNNSFQSVYPCWTDDYQYFVNNSLSAIAFNQPSNVSAPNQNDTQRHMESTIPSDCSSMQTLFNSMFETMNNQKKVTPVEQYSENHVHDITNIQSNLDDSKSPEDRPRQYRKARAYFHPKQMSCLESFFQKNPYLSTRDREYLSRKLNLSEDRIRTWFQNRRMREKRKPGTQCDSDNSSVNSCVKVDYS